MTELTSEQLHPGQLLALQILKRKSCIRPKATSVEGQHAYGIGHRIAQQDVVAAVAIEIGDDRFLAIVKKGARIPPLHEAPRLRVSDEAADRIVDQEGAHLFAQVIDHVPEVSHNEKPHVVFQVVVEDSPPFHRNVHDENSVADDLNHVVQAISVDISQIAIDQCRE
ncbi:MAG: hypothetical protein MI919_30530 [Holophagales bacterium]|nr:hypothetical protein [Holophagales bacterium]